MSRFDGTRGPPEINGMTSLKVDNLTYRTTMDDLEKYVRRQIMHFRIHVQLSC